jgi:hypothetical protein
MRSCALIVVMFAACGGTASPAKQPIGGDSARVAPTTPAPDIAFAITAEEQMGAFHARGLPAVGRGGQVVVAAVHDSDGGRGYPNLRLEVRDREDKLLQTIPVMSANEYETLVAGGAATPALTARVSAANGELAKLHGVHDLVAMRALEPIAPADEELRHMCTGDGFDVDYRSGQLAIYRHNSQRPLVERGAVAWEAPAHQVCATCEPCANPSYLAAAFHARGINAVVVEIGYRGNDSCWEPGNTFHVVTW